MAWIGQAPDALIAAPTTENARAWRAGSAPWIAWGALGAAACVALATCLWGFTVDDALVSIRYARHLSAGLGYRFNAGGPSTDGVTPLAWPLLLAPLARAGAWTVLVRAKALGLAVYAVTGAAFGVAVGHEDAPRWVKAVALATLAGCVPCAAYAVSGMETSLATALCTWAALAATGATPQPRRAALLAGLAASLRPELVPWAAVVGVGLASSPAGALGGAALAGAPFAACCLARLLAFGHVAPLAIAAKPSDLSHGLSYAAAAGLAALAPVLALAPFAVLRSGRATKTLAVAGAVHLAAVAAAGGDWMPYARLVAPVVPSLLVVFVSSARYASRASLAARAVVTLGLGAYLLARAAPAARPIVGDREALVQRATPLLARARTIASLDVGWPTAATEADVLDLGGLTDPEIAALPGGQTSKRVSDAWLVGQRPEALLLYTTALDPSGGLERWQTARFPRVLEARLAASALVAERFAPRAFLPLGSAGAGYVVLAPRHPDL